MWTVSAVVLIAIALLAIKPSIRLTQWLFHYASINVIHESSLRPGRRLEKFMAHALRRFSELQHSGLVNARLVRRLLLLSSARFCVVVLMARQTSEAIGAHIVLWRMAAATPFATIANLIGVTPGGIGVNELTSVAALHLFGTPLVAASQWALANRFLVTGSCFVVAACASVMLGIEKIVAPGSRTVSWSGKSEGV